MELTREKVLAMESGRALDKLVAERVFKMDLSGYNWERLGKSVFRETASGVTWIDIPDYSTDISAAWEVVHKMHEDGICFTTRSRIEGEYKYFQVHTFNCDTEKFTESEDKSAPLAICRAALLTTIKE